MVEQRECIREGVIESPDVAEGDAAPRPHVARPRVEVVILAVRDSGVEVHESGGVAVLGDRFRGEIRIGACRVFGQIGGECEIETAGEQCLAFRGGARAHGGDAQVVERVRLDLDVAERGREFERPAGPDSGLLVIVCEHPHLREVAVRHGECPAGPERFEARDRPSRVALGIRTATEEPRQA